MKPCLPTRSVIRASVLFMRVRPHDASSVLLAMPLAEGVLLAVVLAGGGGGSAVVACAAGTGTMLKAGLSDGGLIRCRKLKSDAMRPQTPTKTMAATRKGAFFTIAQQGRKRGAKDESVSDKKHGLRQRTGAVNADQKSDSLSAL